DSLKITTLIELSKQYQYVDVSKSNKYAQEAVGLSENKNLKWAKVQSYLNSASLSSAQGDNNAALKFANQALGVSYERSDSVELGICYVNLGIYSVNVGRLDEGYNYHTQAYRIAVKTRNDLVKVISLHNIAGIFKELGQYERALEYLKLSANIAEAINDKKEEPYNLDEKGDILIRQRKYDSAIIVLSQSRKIAKKLDLRIYDLEGSSLHKIAMAYSLKGEYAKAVAYYDSASAFFKMYRNNFGEAKVNLGRGVLLLNQKKTVDAEKLILNASEIAHNLRAWTLEIQCYEKLSDLYEVSGDYKKSLSFYKQRQLLEDSLFSQGMQSKLLQNEIRFETELKEDQIKALTRLEVLRKSEIKKQELIRNILAVVVALTVVLLFSVYRSGQRRIRISKLLLQHQDEIKRRSSELEQLNQVKDKFFSIVSHDLRSPMNALSGILDLMNKEQVTQQEFKNLSKELQVRFNYTRGLINNLLDWALLQMDKLKIQLEKINLKELVDSNISMIESLQLKKLTIKNQIDADINALGDKNMVNLVIRNLVTNAIKFSEEGSDIIIAAKELGDYYAISVQDFGVGIAPEIQKILFEKTTGYSTRGTANEKGTGLGLILCKEFVERNGGKIWLESEPEKGSTFFFTIKRG
ncbi:MAG: ATP-binding protein, partial [Flammeovirgaceae bacterium]